MKLSETILEGIYYDGRTPVARPAMLVLKDNVAQLTGKEISLTCTPDQLRVSPRAGRADRFIGFSDGGQCQCADDDILDQLPQDVLSEGPVAWLEDRISVAIASIAVIVCVVMLGYVYGLPAAAKSLTRRIPVETEVSMGSHVVTWLDDNKWFQPTTISGNDRQLITDRFNRLHQGLSMSPYIRLEFRNSTYIGPNAFAFPGGTIVMTDQMVQMAESTDEVLAILAHELGHVENRHSMRQILQSSFVALAAATITADAASLSAAVTGLPTLLVQKKYSRNFETEADEFAFDLLIRNNISTSAFATLMERLDKNSGKRNRLSFLSTHPITEERIKRARELSQ